MEHFFDGYKDNKKYALKCIKTAADAKADVLVMCDTNGGTLPEDVGKIVTEVKEFMKREMIKTELGVHMHNDSGCGVANTLNDSVKTINFIKFFIKTLYLLAESVF